MTKSYKIKATFFKLKKKRQLVENLKQGY